MVGLCDSLALTLNDNVYSDIIYFDFAKAFDSVNHDIILRKLKDNFGIDGKLLRFIAAYLKDRKQCVLVGNKISSPKCAKSGVPQGSILGPLLFVLFINDISDGISPGTNISLYADDTKIWRPIHSDTDMRYLENDIKHLHEWCVRNKMRFHPDKCKVLPVLGRFASSYSLQLLTELPFTNHHNTTMYSLNGTVLDVVESEKDLGVLVTSKFDWTDQCVKIYSKANQKLGLTKRTSYFVSDSNRRRVLYLTMVRSQFEHCSQIWRPTTTALIDKLERLQKRAIKWVLFEEYVSYTPAAYISKCKQLNIMPLSDRFDFLDLTFFYKIVKGMIPVELPAYIVPYQGNSRLRSSHLDDLSFVSNVTPRIANGPLARGFFYRTFAKWNHIPRDIRVLDSLVEFKRELSKHMWDNIAPISDDATEVYEYDSEY